MCKTAQVLAAEWEDPQRAANLHEAAQVWREPKELHCTALSELCSNCRHCEGWDPCSARTLTALPRRPARRPGRTRCVLVRLHAARRQLTRSTQLADTIMSMREQSAAVEACVLDRPLATSQADAQKALLAAGAVAMAAMTAAALAGDFERMAEMEQLVGAAKRVRPGGRRSNLNARCRHGRSICARSSKLVSWLPPWRARFASGYVVPLHARASKARA